jgi:hypothetical protein
MKNEIKVTTFCKKGYSARFSHYRQGYLYYEVNGWVQISADEFDIQLQKFVFPVEIADLGGATVSSIEKSVTLMRYIRKAIEDGTMVRIWPRIRKPKKTE